MADLNAVDAVATNEIAFIGAAALIREGRTRPRIWPVAAEDPQMPEATQHLVEPLVNLVSSWGLQVIGAIAVFIVGAGPRVRLWNQLRAFKLRRKLGGLR